MISSWKRVLSEAPSYFSTSESEKNAQVEEEVMENDVMDVEGILAPEATRCLHY